MSVPSTVLRRARRLLLALAAGLALYAFARFDVVLLPAGARSPLYGVHPGDRLVVDRHARAGAPGQTWLFRGPDGALLLGRVEPPPAGLPAAQRAALEEGALWLCFERPIPGLADSRTLGPIAREACAGRVLFVWPG